MSPGVCRPEDAPTCFCLCGTIRNKDGGWQPNRSDCTSLFWCTRWYSQGTSLFFPEFLYYPIRCALAAHGDDLGLFIPTRLNIYFSAQGEAEKKNVSRRDSTSGGFNTSPPNTHTHCWRLQDKSWWHPRNHGIRIRAQRCACIFCKVTVGSASCLSFTAASPLFFIATHCFDSVPLFNDP